MADIQIADAWKRRARALLGNEADTLLHYCQTPVQKSIRLNTLRYGKDHILEQLAAAGWELHSVPWCPLGYWVMNRTREDIGRSVWHALDYFYIQDAVSLIPAEILAPKTQMCVLDMAAAPGSKTGHLATMMQDTGGIVANDVALGRLPALRANMDKIGATNVLVSQHDGRAFAQMRDAFDAVLVDAPCSATGTVRKNPGVLENWQPNQAQSHRKIQESLLSSAITATKPGGFIVYATCSLEPEENEAVVDAVARNNTVALIPSHLSGLQSRPGITEWNNCAFVNAMERTVRIYPQDNNTQGFYVACLQKTGDSYAISE